jgi:hypothetical protein
VFNSAFSVRECYEWCTTHNNSVKLSITTLDNDGYHFDLIKTSWLKLAYTSLEVPAMSTHVSVTAEDSMLVF